MTEFIGFPRPDGSVGTRNHILLLGLDPTGVNICRKVAGLVKETLLVFPGPHERGVLEEVVGHPNVAGSVVVGEGLEEQDGDSLISDLDRSGKPHGVIDLGGMGFMEAIAGATHAATDIVQDVSTHRRELVRFSKLLPVLFRTADDLVTEVLVSFMKRVTEENGRCLWVEKGAKNQKALNTEFKIDLQGNVEMGEAPGTHPGIYRYMGPGSDKAIWRTLLVSGAQIMVFPLGSRRFTANALIPGLNFSCGTELRTDQVCDLNLGQKEDRNLSIEDASLLLFSEILATASGKLTRQEVLGDVLIM